MVDRLKVAVIFGGRSGEHEVSLMSARSVLSVLDPQKYEIIQVGITQSGAWVTGPDVLTALEQHSEVDLIPAAILPDAAIPGLYAVLPGSQGAYKFISTIDVAFPVLHGTFGEDGTIQGLFEMAGIAYVGTGVLASSVGMDKALFKDVMRANQIPVVDSLLYSRSRLQNDMDAVLTDIETTFGFPVFVKPVNLGSSVGISKCSSRSDLLEGLMDAARYDRRLLVERAVNAREIEVSVLGNEDAEASVPGEIRPGGEFYSYAAKYEDTGSELFIPAPLPEHLQNEIRRLAVAAYKAVDGAGMARVDFLLDRDSSELYLSEINTIPGFTKISMYPKLWEATGLSYQALVDRLIELAMSRKAERDSIERIYGRNA
jgi:D-alanine-D-alanine ligase